MPSSNNFRYLALRNTKPGGSTNWPENGLRHVLYDYSLTRDAALASFIALSPAQKLATSTVDKPDPGAGQVWQARTVVLTQDGPWDLDTDTPSRIPL